MDMDGFRVTPVKIAEIKVSNDHDELLVAYSLGSCVGVALWDPGCRAGGMAHVFLPSPRQSNYIAASGNSEIIPGRFRPTEPNEQPGKYGTMAVSNLIHSLAKSGCKKERLVAVIAGGANVIPGLSSPFGDVGVMNLKAVEEALAVERVKVVGRDTGGNYGRSMYLYVDAGVVKIASISGPEKEFRFKE